MNDQPLAWAPNLDDAIDRQPLMVLPTMPLLEVIALISQTTSRTCALGDDQPARPAKEGRASCVLVMQDQKLLGIWTERDVVRLAAKSIDFASLTIADVMIHPIITLPQRSVQDIFAALFLFRRYRIRHLPIMDDDGKLVGVISHESIRQILRPANLLRFRLVSDVMTTPIVHAALTTTIRQLAQLMAEQRVSCVVITQPDGEENEKPVGIVTERDIVQLQALQLDFDQTSAETVMSTPLFLLNPEDSLWTAHQEMQTRRVGRLVVSWNWGKGLGIVTQTSLLRVFDPMEMHGIIENLQQTIQQLEAERANVKQTALSDAGSDGQPGLSVAPGLEVDRALLTSLLAFARLDVHHLLDDAHLSLEQQQLLLRSLINQLERIEQEIKC
jgi:CBS domain-containing protein